MDYLSLIREPITAELEDFIRLFNQTLDHTDGMLSRALEHIKNRGGKRMRPILLLLIAKNFGPVTEVAQRAAIGLELLHTASLVHDDVVDESTQRRGQASVNALYDNKVSVLVGDYILSTALLNISFTHAEPMVRYLAELGRTLSDGEIMQLSNISSPDFSEETYFNIIQRKTAALFEACAILGAMAANATEEQVSQAAHFGRNLGIIFQIRDDIFDYYPSESLGKPTGNDMIEGKLTLPALYALNQSGNEQMRAIGQKVKNGSVTADEIARLVAFTKANGGMEYAEKRMREYRLEAQNFLQHSVADPTIRRALQAYLDFVIDRKS